MSTERGVTLVELMFGIALLAVFLGSTHQFTRSLLRGVRVLEVASEAQERARIGVQIIERDLREAGFDPAGTRAPGIARAERDAIRILRDLNGDGDTDDSNERVTYRYSGGRGALMRGLGNAPEQPMLDDVPAGGLELRYFDDAGNAIPLPPGGLDANERARIRRVDVRLTIEMPHPDPAFGRPIRRLQTASIQLRNPSSQGDPS
jgi:hypothetical protein